MHEDISVRLFMLSLHLEDNLAVKNWYEGFICRSFSSLRQFINAFNMDWDYGIEEQERNAMIDRIWEETLGRIQIQDDSRERTKDDILFDFEDPDNPTAIEMEIGFASLDLSTFLGYSDELPKVF